ncbi:MAG: hypothetical protein NTZ12_05675 [Candidatus Aminicenantes bacterium]|nr:hypothetical protein [Candidatus Aminicenantes bacterium]
MPIVSIETITLLLRIAFLVGAVTDGLALIPMLSRRIGAALFGGDSSRANFEYRFAMGIGAALMAGWTLLLLWGAASPIARRDILLLTVFPVISGIVLATVMAARRGLVSVARMIPLWLHLGTVSLFYIIVYVLSIPFAQ